ncbi:MAG: IS30 family transposase, partial [Oscillospiraceae bacterium]|nr:IS30 family transposase [Oscillospiraceae bacterium]
MEKSIITQRRKEYKHILRDDRITIEKLLRARVEHAEIARIIGCSGRTLTREIERGMCEQLESELTRKLVYFADYGERKHAEKARNKGPYPKLNDASKLRERIEKAIKEEKCSPYAALEKAKEEGFAVEVSVKTVYNSIDRGDLAVTRKDLLRKDGWRQEKTAPRQGFHTKGKSIDERPTAANDRSEAGHWEGDLIVGKKGTKSALFTLTDRKTKEEIIVKLPDKTQTSVIAAVLRLKAGNRRATVPCFKSVTFDNGSEFLNFEELEKAFGCNVFYAHPYSSWERG